VWTVECSGSCSELDPVIGDPAISGPGPDPINPPDIWWNPGCERDVFEDSIFKAKAAKICLRGVLEFGIAQWLKYSCAMCSIERDALRSRGSKLSSGASTYQRIISNNAYAHDEEGYNPGQEKEGATVSSINCDRC